MRLLTYITEKRKNNIIVVDIQPIYNIKGISGFNRYATIRDVLYASHYDRPQSINLTDVELKQAKEIVEYELNKIIDSYKKGNLKGFVKSDNEGMILCREYYMIDMSYRPDLWYYLENRDYYLKNPDEWKLYYKG